MKRKMLHEIAVEGRLSEQATNLAWNVLLQTHCTALGEEPVVGEVEFAGLHRLQHPLGDLSGTGLCGYLCVFKLV